MTINNIYYESISNEISMMSRNEKTLLCQHFNDLVKNDFELHKLFKSVCQCMKFEI